MVTPRMVEAALTTRKLKDIEVVSVDSIKRILYAAYHATHVTESNLEAEGIYYVLFEVNIKRSIGAVGDFTRLPIGTIIKLKSSCLSKRNSVVIAKSILVKSLGVNGQRS